MRRKDREITDFDEIIRIIKKCDSCRLAFNDGEFPYIVPLNFGLKVMDGHVSLYFHCASEGKKIDLIRQNGKASFEMDCNHQFILYEDRMSCTMGYESVMGHGNIEFVPDKEKFEALKILMGQYHEEDFVFNTKLMPVTTVFRLNVTDMTAKRRDNVHRDSVGRGLRKEQ